MRLFQFASISAVIEDILYGKSGLTEKKFDPKNSHNTQFMTAVRLI